MIHFSAGGGRRDHFLARTGDLEVSLSPDLDEIDSNETDAFADSLREAAIALSIDVAASPLADVAVGGARKFGIGDSVV